MSLQSGPKACRSGECPWGFPWATGRTLRARGARQTCGAWACACSPRRAPPWIATEALPVVLGIRRTWGWSHDGRPASIRCCITLPRASLGVLQRWFGADYAQPARKCCDVEPLLQLQVAAGKSQLNGTGRYCGPLPLQCGHAHGTRLRGKSSAGQWATAAGALPPDVWAWIAKGMVRHWWALRGAGPPLSPSAAAPWAQPLAGVPRRDRAALHRPRHPYIAGARVGQPVQGRAAAGSRALLQATCKNRPRGNHPCQPYGPHSSLQVPNGRAMPRRLGGASRTEALLIPPTSSLGGGGVEEGGAAGGAQKEEVFTTGAAQMEEVLELVFTSDKEEGGQPRAKRGAGWRCQGSPMQVGPCDRFPGGVWPPEREAAQRARPAGKTPRRAEPSSQRPAARRPRLPRPRHGRGVCELGHNSSGLASATLLQKSVPPRDSAAREEGDCAGRRSEPSQLGWQRVWPPARPDPGHIQGCQGVTTERVGLRARAWPQWQRARLRQLVEENAPQS